MTITFEVNLVGLPGPTHHYGGHALDNRAAQSHKQQAANPQAAALQSLEHMQYLHDHGIRQIILPPQPRPCLAFLRSLGFRGEDAAIIQAASQKAPQLYLAACSASAMWAANAGTISPSTDTADHKVHITPSNLNGHLHRSLETAFTTKILQSIFPDPDYFTHHAALFSQSALADEGAANQCRFCKSHEQTGLHLWVYGRDQDTQSLQKGRQTLAACAALARKHQLSHYLFAEQNPKAIRAGVFHNDVISTNYENIFLYHEESFVNTSHVVQKISEFLDGDFYPIKITTEQLSISEAVATYLFNSQIITTKDQKCTIITPQECMENTKTKRIIQEILAADNPISHHQALDLKQSMNNGGGPACLRLRAVLNQSEWQAIKSEVIFNPTRYLELKKSIKSLYPTHVTMKELSDPDFLRKTRAATQGIYEILNLNMENLF